MVFGESSMPAFKDKLTGAQIEALADLSREPEVSAATARPAAARTSAGPLPGGRCMQVTRPRTDSPSFT